MIYEVFAEIVPVHVMVTSWLHVTYFYREGGYIRFLTCFILSMDSYYQDLYDPSKGHRVGII